MKYLILGQRGAIRRITDNEPLGVDENTMVVEITDEQAAAITELKTSTPREIYFYVDGDVLTMQEKIEHDKWQALTLEEAKSAKISELTNAAKNQCGQDIIVDGVGIFHVDASTLHDLRTIEEIVKDGTSPILVGGEYSSYKCVDGQMINLGLPELAAIKEALTVRKYNAYSVTLKQQINAVHAAITKQELASIT